MFAILSPYHLRSINDFHLLQAVQQIADKPVFRLRDFLHEVSTNGENYFISEKICFPPQFLERNFVTVNQAWRISRMVNTGEDLRFKYPTDHSFHSHHRRANHTEYSSRRHPIHRSFLYSHKFHTDILRSTFLILQIHILFIPTYSVYIVISGIVFKIRILFSSVTDGVTK